ncbi:MAG: hypothetical protein R3C15_17950 [Thermoleophilia bacterium]
MITGSAAAADSVRVVDGDGYAGEFTSLALDGGGNPVIGYSRISSQVNGLGSVVVAHCDDADCATVGASFRTVDDAGNVGFFKSMVLDGSGNPVLSYYDVPNSDLKVAHCTDPDCTSPASVETVDSAGDVGWYTSLRLDASGNPVVSYFDIGNGDLKVVHCNDANCAGGDDAPSTVDSAGEVGWFSSLQLDRDGNPVIAYYDVNNTALKLAHCNDPGCRGDDESISTVDSASIGAQVVEGGGERSLQLDADGHPVISYARWDGGLRIAHCNDPNCAGEDEWLATVDPAAGAGMYSSLALDAAGNPVASYLGPAEVLRVAHCKDPRCDAAAISTVDPSRAGYYSSLALDAAGNPVVSSFEMDGLDLKLVHCDDPDCSSAQPPTITVGRGGTCLGEPGTAATLPLLLSDPDTPASQLEVAATTANGELVRSLDLSGSGGNRTLALTGSDRRSGRTVTDRRRRPRPPPS